MKSNRRSFLKQAAALSAVPFILPSKVWSAEVNPSERITMGFIGTGKQNNHLMNSFIQRPNVRVVAVCDVDTTRRTAAQARVNEFYTGRPELGSADCAAYNDFLELIARDDIDAVCIATPDHWHAIQVIAALKAGKDVYCEKPLTHNVHEAVEIMKAVKKYKRVLQTGSMQRSMEEFRVACELVRNGAIGKISHVECSFGAPGLPCDLPEEPMEPGLDWDRWIGPGPMRPYNAVLSPRGVHDHFPMWRLYKEYGGGFVCDWGAHHLDIAQWGLGMDESGPIKVEAPADPAAVEGGILHYKGGIPVHHKSGFGVHFHGADGEVKVNRGQFEFWLGGKQVSAGSSVEATVVHVQKEYLANAKVKLYQSRDHIADFLECIQSRQKPITNEIVGGRTAIACHLLNQAYYNHATIAWKPKRMKFARNGGKAEWLTREYRGPWTV